MQRIVIDIRISADELQKVYAGKAHSVFARARDGRKIRFPAIMLRSFVTASGVEGSFVLEVNEHMKLQGIHRL